MLEQGWILLAGTFYLSPFLCKFLAVPGCLLFVAECIYLSFPHPQKNVTSLPFLSFVFLFFLIPLPLTLAVFPSGCCRSALELSCWKCQKLAFPLAEWQWCSSSPQCIFCLLTGIMLALTCSWWMLCISCRDTCLTKQCHCSLLLFKN